jgi:RNA polymerase sigma-70 factor (ECF subfamily)
MTCPPRQSVSAGCDLILLEQQDRTLWDRHLIEEGSRLVDEALAARRAGPYSLQAAIAALHAGARTAADTDWNEIAGLYDVLARMAPSPVVALNRAVAIAMRDGPVAGLAVIDGILADGALAGYHLAHSARADLCRRLGRLDDARTSYQRALDLARLEPEQRFLRGRLADLDRLPPDAVAGDRSIR